MQKECQGYLRSTFAEIQYQCRHAITETKTAIADTKQAIKLQQADGKIYEDKLATAKTAFAQKKTKTAENAVKKMTTKLKEAKRLQRQHMKNLAQLAQQLMLLLRYKTKAKATETALKAFEKDYKTPSEPGLKTNTKETKEMIATTASTETLRPGDKAPDFTSVLEDNNVVSLNQFKGKNVVLYFYPKDNTPGCTQQAEDFTSMADQFAAKDTVILGVSRDSMASHHKFAARYAIPYILLADTDEAICKAYGVIKQKNMYGKKVRGIERSTFLIDQQGILKAVWRGVKVPGHVETVLAAIE